MCGRCVVDVEGMEEEEMIKRKAEVLSFFKVNTGPLALFM